MVIDKKKIINRTDEMIGTHEYLEMTSVLDGYYDLAIEHRAEARSLRALNKMIEDGVFDCEEPRGTT